MWTDQIRSLLARQGENGGPFWSRADGDIHAPAGFSTIDVLGTIGDLGGRVGDEPDLAAAVEFVFGYQSDDGAFRYGKSTSKFPCFAGRIGAALCRVGVDPEDERLAACFGWMLAKQHPDGGWRCATVRAGKSPETDASNPGATLYVLDAFRFAPAPDVAALDRAVETLLDHWVTRRPLGPCAFGIGSRFLTVEYPFLRYNLFYYVYVLSHYRAARDDPRFREALAALAENVRDGQMIVAHPHRAWHDAAIVRRGEPSRLATERWAEIQAQLGASA